MGKGRDEESTSTKFVKGKTLSVRIWQSLEDIFVLRRRLQEKMKGEKANKLLFNFRLHDFFCLNGDGRIGGS